LIETPSERWDELWLKRLHLFNVVLTDEREWRNNPGSVAEVNHGETFFEDLVRSDKKRLVRVFSSFATVDPPAAFRLAEAIGFNLVDEHPGLIVQKFDDPAFRGVTIQKFEEISVAGLDEDHLHRWAVILANAGMSNDSIADDLIDRDPTTPMRHEVERLPRSRRWFRPGQLPSMSNKNIWSRGRIIGPSLYTFAVSIALDRGSDLLDRDIFGLGVLRRLKAPGAWVPTWLIITTAAAIDVGIFLGESSIAEWGFVSSRILLFSAILLAGNVTFFSVRYAIGRHFLYGILMNILPLWKTFSLRLLGVVTYSNRGSIPFITWRLTRAGRTLGRSGFNRRHGRIGQADYGRSQLISLFEESVEREDVSDQSPSPTEVR
jgi:hypothetical protein